MVDRPFELTPSVSVYELRAEAARTFLPSRPITRQELLLGREDKLRRTLDTLSVPGRSVFVYGERGVGKTSLAQTAAYAFNSSDVDPVFLSCHPEMTFGRLMSQVARRLLQLAPYRQRRREVTELGLQHGAIKLLKRIEQEEGEFPAQLDLNDAVDLFKAISPSSARRQSVVVIDELDVLTNPEVKRDLAFFLKQVGDQDCPTKFILVGIADDVSDLLSHHESASRYMATVKLDRLPIDVLRDIILNGFRKLGATVWEPLAMRIGIISDGFPHFTHLVGLKLALQLLGERVPEPFQVVPASLPPALDDAIQDSESWLRAAYDKAVQKYKDRYEPILWAVADHWELDRATEHMFASYLRIADQLNIEPLERKQFSLALNALKRPTHGEVLVSSRPSWYRFRQTMLRGYCRMVANAKGIEVGRDYHVAKDDAATLLRGRNLAEGDHEPAPEEVEAFDREEG